MGVSYEIGIMANNRAAKAIDAFFESEDAKKNWSEYERKELSDGSTMYRTWCNNHPSWYKIGKKFLEVIRGFEKSNYEPDALRCIMVSEEGFKEEISNTPGQLFFEDFESSNEINYPVSFEDSGTDDESIAADKAIMDIALNCDREKSSEVMASLLMDDKVSSYEMFEDLASAYHLHGSEYRNGMDLALSILTGHKLVEIAEIVKETVQEEE